jgi:single-strand DNA-binding protein
MASFNRVILAGNLTRDPQLSYTPSNVPVCEIGLATNRRFRDKDGNQRDEVCFVDLQAYGRTAETINQYFQKGKPILVEGRLRFREWTNQQGQKRNKLDVVVENFSFIDSGGGQQNGGQGGQSRGGYRHPAQSQQQEPEPGPYDDGPPPVDADIPF